MNRFLIVMYTDLLQFSEITRDEKSIKSSVNELPIIGRVKLLTSWRIQCKIRQLTSRTDLTALHSN